MKKGSKVKIGLALAVFGLFYIYLNAVILLNDPSAPFPGPKSGDVGGRLVDSASLTLKSGAEACLFLNEYELSEKNPLNLEAALKAVDSAIGFLQAARDVMKQIVGIGFEVGYDEERIEKLVNFDYQGFAEKNGLNHEIMAEVAEFLSRGDVLGFYQKVIDRQGKILDLLQQIRSDLLAGLKSDRSLAWSLVQQYAGHMMFANYATLVFYQL